MDPIFDPAAIEQWATDVGIFGMMNTKWGWPIAEIIHFYGLCLLIGTVGMFDLRMMGVARGVTMKELHLMCVTTGFLFVVSAPAQYIYNPAMQMKIMLMAIAGANMAMFYATASAGVNASGADDLPPVRARVIGAVSLSCWLLVIVFGRLVTFFRPPEHWCLWCQ